MNKNELVIGRSSYTVRFCNLTPVPALKMIKIIIPWNWVCYCLTKAIWILLFLVIIVEWSIVERCYDKCSYIFLFTISMNNSPTGICKNGLISVEKQREPMKKSRSALPQL